jgi:5-methylcytosine-specific restriction endonuclease McrA
MRRVNLVRAHGSPTHYQYTKRQCRCAVCRAEWAAYGSAHYAANRAVILAKQNAHNREHCEHKRRYDATHYALHREEKRAYQMARRNDLRAYGAAYRAAHPEAIATHHRNRRARITGNGGRHSASDVQSQYARQAGLCFYCKRPVESLYHVDHFVPLARGGSNGPENIVVACPACNMAKHDKMPHEFIPPSLRDVCAVP